MTRVRLSDITFDAGTQIRAAIDEQVVADYADAMTAGAQFPPIVLFHDGNRHYLADGFHRYMAAQRNQWREIDAVVHAGTQQDALWFALGANRKNAHRMTDADKRHAIELAFMTWRDRSAKQIADQIGCSSSYASKIREQLQGSTTATLPDRIIRRDGKSQPATLTPRRGEHPKHAEIVALVRAGKGSNEICSALNVRSELVANVRRELGVAKVDTSRDAVRSRREQMRKMAADGHTSRQIATVLGLTEEVCRRTLRDEGIDVPADRVVGRTHRHDSNRIVAQIVADAENLTEGVDLVNFADLDHAQIAEWLKSLQSSRDRLGAFIRRLTKEQQKHGEAA